MSFLTTIARLREASYAAPAAGENPNTCRVGLQDLRTALHLIDRLDADLRQAGVLSQGSAPMASAPVAGEAQTYRPTKIAVREACALLDTIKKSHAHWGGWSSIPSVCDEAIGLLRSCGTDAAPQDSEAVRLDDLKAVAREVAADSAATRAEARNAALEEVAALVGGHSWANATGEVSALIARHIRALKSQAALSAKPAEKPATFPPSPASGPRQQIVSGSSETGNSHTDGGAVYE